MKIINNLLQGTPEAYEAMLFDTYFNWCIKYGLTPSRTQSLLANSRVNKWFNNEYQKLELQFLSQVNPKHTVTVIRELYADVTSNIFNYYPTSAVTCAKKIKFNTKNYN